MARGKKNETATEIASGRNTNFRERSATPAANMLRIIRGAGKPYELLVQMKKASIAPSSSKSFTVIGLLT
jgi:hypothetical protein